jgi:hypothetical protein
MPSTRQDIEEIANGGRNSNMPGRKNSMLSGLFS